MSLETDVANLVTKTESLISYFNTRKSGIDKAVADAVAAIPDGSKNFYVNQLAGADTNAGTAAAPLKSIDKAISNTPFGGVCQVFLQADYIMSANISVDGRFVHVRSDTAGISRKLTANYYTLSDLSITYLAGFFVVNGAQILLTDLAITFTSSSGFSPAPSGFTDAFIKGSSGAGAPLLGLKMTSCSVAVAADFAGWILGAPNTAVVFMTRGVTFPPSFGGKYIYGVASGTNPNVVNNLLTNLPSL